MSQFNAVIYSVTITENPNRGSSRVFEIKELFVPELELFINFSGGPNICISDQHRYDYNSKDFYNKVTLNKEQLDYLNKQKQALQDKENAASLFKDLFNPEGDEEEKEYNELAAEFCKQSASDNKFEIIRDDYLKTLSPEEIEEWRYNSSDGIVITKDKNSDLYVVHLDTTKVKEWFTYEEHFTLSKSDYFRKLLYKPLIDE